MQTQRKMRQVSAAVQSPVQGSCHRHCTLLIGNNWDSVSNHKALNLPAQPPPGSICCHLQWQQFDPHRIQPLLPPANWQEMPVPPQNPASAGRRGCRGSPGRKARGTAGSESQSHPGMLGRVMGMGGQGVQGMVGGCGHRWLRETAPLPSTA